MSEINLDGLSDDAKAVAGAMFGMMKPNSANSGLAFGTPSRITKRANAALTELVNADVIALTIRARDGSWEFKPKVSCYLAFMWLHDLVQAGDAERISFPMVHDRNPDDHMILEPPRADL